MLRGATVKEVDGFASEYPILSDKRGLQVSVHVGFEFDKRTPHGVSLNSISGYLNRCVQVYPLRIQWVDSSPIILCG